MSPEEVRNLGIAKNLGGGPQNSSSLIGNIFIDPNTGIW
jgi:hypothetical protein